MIARDAQLDQDRDASGFITSGTHRREALTIPEVGVSAAGFSALVKSSHSKSGG